MEKRIFGTLDPFIEGGEILGRKVANEGFLRALLNADFFDEYHFFLSSASAIPPLDDWLKKHYPVLKRRGAFMLTLQQGVHLAMAERHYYCFHLSDCLNRSVSLARLRNTFSKHIFPISAPTHSLSYERFMPAYFSHLWQGTSSRDAIITTSQSALSMLNAVFSRLGREYGLRLLSPNDSSAASKLHWQTGTETNAMPHADSNQPQHGSSVFYQPLLAHIPLGVFPSQFPCSFEHWDSSPAAKVMPADFSPAADCPDSGEGSAAALAMRKRLGLKDECVFLCLARISAASKMDLLPIFSALKRAESLGLKNHALIVAGWAEQDDPLPDVLKHYAASMGLRLIPFLRPSDAEKRILYAASDVFLSPSDNIQETFGLTLAEAGASGLPVIASDFDGYRDIIVHGETGFLIPTLGFADTAESSVLAGIWFDNQYHLKLAQEVVVDVPALAAAAARLGNSPDLRKEMGLAARKRIASEFSWEVVMNKHLTLWETLSQTPITISEEKRLRCSQHPLRMDFANDFKSHFTSVLDHTAASALFLKRTALGDAFYRGKIPLFRYAGFEYMLDETILRRVLCAARKPINAQKLINTALEAFVLTDSIAVKADPPAPGSAIPFQERAAFLVLFALKQDYLEIAG